MKFARLIALCILFIGMLYLFGNYAYTELRENYLNKDASNTIVNASNNNKNIACLYFNQLDFVNIKQGEIKNDIGAIHGCIVPHHLVARDLIHEVFQNVSKNKYKTIILIGPDHESLEKGKIFTTLCDWQTPFGIQRTDKDITNKLLGDIVFENDIKMTVEHSIAGIVPFIKYYFDDVQIITLAVTRQAKINNINKIVNKILDNIDVDEALFISSIDFSHYLPLDTASKMDAISMNAIKNKNTKQIMSFTNDNLDSPICIVAILEIMKKIKADNYCMLNHSNSQLILKKTSDETTSYLTYLFY